MKNFEYCVQIYKHRLALKKLIENNAYLSDDVKEQLLKRASVHDMDKMVMCLFWDKDEAEKYHRESAYHHYLDRGIIREYAENVIYDEAYLDYLETIFNWECVGITEPDNSLNAYETVIKRGARFLISRLRWLHMDSSYKVRDTFGITDLFVTKDDILREVVTYLLRNNDNIYTRLKDKLCSKEEYIQLFRQRRNIPALRGLDEAYDKISCEINNFFYGEGKLERAQSKLLRGTYKKSRYFSQRISTQKYLKLDCVCNADTKSIKYYISIPIVRNFTPHNAFLKYEVGQEYCTSFDELRCMCSDFVQLCKGGKFLLGVGDLSVYIFNDYIFGVVAEEIVFCFAYFKDETQIVSCRLKGNYLIFDYVDISTYNNASQSFKVSVIDYVEVFS